MSLATTILKIATTLEGVDGVQNVQAAPIPTTDREEAERQEFRDLHLRSWRIAYTCQIMHLGAQTAAHTEVDVVIRARHEVIEGRTVESFAEFASLLESAAQALALPSGLPQISDPGVQIESGDVPFVTDSGHLCWEAVLRFHLLDVTST